MARPAYLDRDKDDIARVKTWSPPPSSTTPSHRTFRSVTRLRCRPPRGRRAVHRGGAGRRPGEARDRGTGAWGHHA